MKSEIERLKSEIIEYVCREKAFTRQMQQAENGHMRRTISLMGIIDALRDEIRLLRHANKDKLQQVSDDLDYRIRELKTLYDICRLRSGPNFSLDHILQAVVDFIPSAIPYPENAGVRILFEHHAYATDDFKDTRWKYSHEIKFNHDCIGVLEICYMEEMAFQTETKKLISAIAESIAQIVEREWAEMEIRKGRARIEELLDQKSC